MEKWTESLDKYLEEGKLPLVGEIFSRKKEIGDKLKLQREESHKIALSRRRKQGAGRSFSFSWGVAAAVVLLLGIGGYFLAEEKVVTDNTAMNYELPDGSTVQVMENSRLTLNYVKNFHNLIFKVANFENTILNYINLYFFIKQWSIIFPQASWLVEIVATLIRYLLTVHILI